MDILYENKDEVFNKFKEFKSLIENHIEKKIKTFQSDNDRDQMNSKTYANNQGLRGSYPLHIIHSKMGLQKEIIERSWKQQGPCFMIKIFPCIYG